MSKQRSDEEGMGPLEQGRGRYQLKDYANALVAFNEVSNGYLNARAVLHSHFGEGSIPKSLL